MKERTRVGLVRSLLLAICVALWLAFVMFVKAKAQESQPAPTSQPAASQPTTRIVRMKVTAYCPCHICCGKWAEYAITSTGKDARICDGVAADPKLLPYGIMLEIPNAGQRVVDDTGGAMRKDAKRGIYHIDLRLPTHRVALAWGVKWLDVKVLQERK